MQTTRSPDEIRRAIEQAYSRRRPAGWPADEDPPNQEERQEWIFGLERELALAEGRPEPTRSHRGVL